MRQSSGFSATSGRGTLTVAPDEDLIKVTARQGNNKIEVHLSTGDFLNLAESGIRMAKTLRTPKSE